MAAPLRYVVLFHRLPAGEGRGDHWDLMFEWAGALRTWALASAPASGASGTAIPLPDHRIEYLDYEGPVSGGRGEVGRWDGGEYQLVAHGEGLWRARLRGRRFAGEALLERRDDQRWTVSFAASSGFPSAEVAGDSVADA
jgi:hypothetical protein